MKDDLLWLMRRDHLVHKWWNLYKLHKTKPPNKWGKEGPKFELEVQELKRGSQSDQGTNYVPKPPLVARSISKKERERKT